jgi:hypothetical protein
MTCFAFVGVCNARVYITIYEPTKEVMGLDRLNLPNSMAYRITVVVRGVRTVGGHEEHSLARP